MGCPFFALMMVLNDVNDLLRDVRLSRYEDAAGITVLSYFMPYKEVEEMDAALRPGYRIIPLHIVPRRSVIEVSFRNLQTIPFRDIAIPLCILFLKGRSRFSVPPF